MSPTPLRRSVALAAPIAAIGAFALLLASGGSGAAAATVHHLAPTVRIDPHVRAAGKQAGTGAEFACQATVPATCYGPAQIRAAYGFDKLQKGGLEGQGTTIVIVDAFQAPTIRYDLGNFDKAFDLPSTELHIIAPDGLTPFDSTDADQVGWTSEISLDVEWAHAIAPKASIDLVLAKTDSDADFEDALDYVARKGLGTVVSQSFSGAECDLPLVRAAHKAYVRMVANGTTPVAGSGDDGTAQYGCTTPFVRSAGNPASDPLVTGVGGTALLANGITGAYGSETVWDEQDYQVAGGSGLSSVFAEPAYQTAVQHTGRRAVPDVSYNAALHEGYLITDTSYGYGPDEFLIFGGTSVGTPQWSALIDLAAQLAGHRLGTVNPALYRLGSSAAYGSLFHDVTRGNDTLTLDNGDGTQSTFTGPSAHPGWDFATGLGSPRADALVPALARAAG